MPSTFLTAEWRKLIMAQYAVSPETLAPWLPDGVEIDLYEGKCFVSLVGFLFDRVRLMGVAVPWHTRFEEVNLRFYVKRVMPDGAVRRGVVFVSEIVPKHAITFVARTLYGEAYSTAKTGHAWSTTETQLRVAYQWMHAGRVQSMSVVADRVARPIAPGSMEEFITEHYWGYTKRGGVLSAGTGEYGVEHPSWQCYPVLHTEVEADFGALYGEAFAGLIAPLPDHVLLAEGSAIGIRWGGRIPTRDVRADSASNIL
jgi:uncharacterized protein YqjF (DUF2071 family)